MGSRFSIPEASAARAGSPRAGVTVSPQSSFKWGGNFGSSLGPLLAAWVVVPHGQAVLLWFTLLASAASCCWPASAAGINVISPQRILARNPRRPPPPNRLSTGRIALALAILGALIFSKYFLPHQPHGATTRFNLIQVRCVVSHARFISSCFFSPSRAGTIIGGPVGDRSGRKYVIWASILGVAPFNAGVCLTWVSPDAGLT